MSSKDQVRDVFSASVRKWAASYKEEAPVTFSDQSLVSRKNFALRLLQNGVPPGSKTLDVGCGAGVFAVELIQHGYDVWGVDLSEAMIKYTRETSGIQQFSVGDSERLEFPDNTFDAVTCLGVIEYLDGDEPALREMWRVLKPGGKAIIATPSADSPLLPDRPPALRPDGTGPSPLSVAEVSVARETTAAQGHRPKILSPEVASSSALHAFRT